MNSESIQECFNKFSILLKESFGDPEAIKLPFQKDVHSWLNYFYKSPVLRHVHLEYYKAKSIVVLHSNIFPNPMVDLPIFGFDMIAIGDKITGLFFDFTPTLTSSAVLENGLSNMHKRYKSEVRKLPEWANFFSDHFYCVAPLKEEMDAIFNDILYYTGHYLRMCKDTEADYYYNINAQNEYCAGQKKNDKTFKALAAEIGDDNAKEFLQTYLFPEIAK